MLVNIQKTWSIWYPILSQSHLILKVSVGAGRPCSATSEWASARRCLNISNDVERINHQVMKSVSQSIHCESHSSTDQPLLFIWLVVSNIFYFPFHIWDVILPMDELHHVCKMVKLHHPDYY